MQDRKRTLYFMSLPSILFELGKWFPTSATSLGPLLSSLLSRMAWLSWYAIESDYIMLFSLIRTWRNNYFLCPYRLWGAAFLKGELALQTRYHYLFWFGRPSGLITRPSHKQRALLLFSGSVWCKTALGKWRHPYHFGQVLNVELLPEIPSSKPCRV